MTITLLPILGLLALPAAIAAQPEAGPGIPVRQWVDGKIYRLEAAPGQLSAVALEPGEKLVAVAAGDTVQWVIGETVSGTGEGARTHILVKPTAPGLLTNMMISTDRRLYHLALESRAGARPSAIRWTYASPGLIAVEAEPKASCPSGLDPAVINFGYRIEGARAPWLPLRAFDDGRRTFIEFAPDMFASQAPPLFLAGPKGRLELLNYRVKGRYYVVDRLFERAELRLGEKKQQQVRIVRLGSEGKGS